MSGFEVAGVVLGAIPIAVEVFRVAADIVRGELQTTVKRLVTQLECTKTIYVWELEKLLAASCRDYQTLRLERRQRAPASNDPVQNEMALIIMLLGDPEIQAHVQGYLGYRMQSFTDNVNAFTSQLVKALYAFRDLLPSELRKLGNNQPHEVLKLLNANRQQEQSPRAIRLALQQFRIYRKQSKLLQIVEYLAQLERNISSLLSDGQKVTKAITPAADSMVEYFDRVRTSALHLYAEIYRIFRGTCHEAHTTQLYLDDRDSASSGKAFCFRLALTRSDAQNRQYAVHESRIYAQTENVRYGMPVNTTSMSEIRDPGLCSHINASHQNGLTLILTLAVDGKLLSGTVGTLQSRSQPINTTVEDVTLSIVLRQWSQLTDASKSKLYRIDRVCLALKIASSFLQLNCTEWATNVFHARGIRFQATCGGDLNNPSYHLEDAKQPFVTCTDAHNVTQQYIYSVPCALTSLAILLLELYHRKPVEVWAAENFQDPTTNPDDVLIITAPERRLKLATQWIEKEQYDMDSGYSQAIIFCLSEASLPFLVWDDINFRCRFAERVIKPIKNLCEQARGI